MPFLNAYSIDSYLDSRVISSWAAFSPIVDNVVGDCSTLNVIESLSIYRKVVFEYDELAMTMCFSFFF